MTRISIHLIITGRVQGVGYRDSMRMVAQALDVTGWVRNLADGSVEALVQGDPAAVEQIIGWCHNGPPGANVRYVDAKPIDSAQEYIAFSRIPNA
ncbi:MAG: acylphosphatase [Burkholderiales bacterium]